MSAEKPANPKRVDAIVINDDAEAPSLLNPLTGDVYVTNAVGKCIMEVADGGKTMDEIVALVCQQFKGAPADVVGRDVQAFVRDGIAKGILVWKEP